MKVVILAGGFGTRIEEETHLKPKPMILIDESPILEHIMKIYSHYGFHEFIICLGYKGHVIKEFFRDYFLQYSDITFDIANRKTTIHRQKNMPWKVTLVETGLNSGTGTRLRKVKNFLKDEKEFMFTYGDGLIDLNINRLQDIHQKNKCLVTLTAVQQPPRFGALLIDDESKKLTAFAEKQIKEGPWVNGGYMVMSTEIFDWIPENDCSFESDVLPLLTEQGAVSAYQHYGFWQPIDTMRDLRVVRDAIKTGAAPWLKALEI